MSAGHIIRMTAAAAGVLVAGCGDGLLVTPAEQPPVTFSLSLAPAAAVMGGSGDAFGKTDGARVRLTSGSSAVLDTSVAVSGAGDRSIAVRVRLPQSPMQLAIGVDLNAAGRTLFKGIGSAQLSRGRRTEAVVQLSPVVAGLVLPDSLPTMTALGDTSRARGAAVFVTGDTVSGAQLAWGDGGSAVVRAGPDGALRALSEGTATLTASYAGISATTHVRVKAIVVVVGFTLGVDTATIDIGSTTQLTAVPRDRNGNALVRTPIWQSADQSVATVDANGNVRAVGSGRTTISAIVEGKAGTVTIIVPPPRIVVRPADSTLISGDSTILAVGDSATFIARAYDSQGRLLPAAIFVWSSSDARLVYVTPIRNNGLAEAYSEGRARIVARIGRDSGFAVVRVVRPVLALGTNQATFTLPVGSRGGPQTISVLNAGSGTICGLTADVRYPVLAVLGASGWLTASLSSPCAPATLSLVARGGHRATRTYTATVVVSSTTRGVNSATVVVTLTVTPPVGFGTTIPPLGGRSQATAAPVAGSP